MIKCNDLWCYLFWRKPKSEKEYLILGIKKKVLISCLLVQMFLVVFVLLLLCIFEGIWYLGFTIIFSTRFFIKHLQKNMFWIRYNKASKKILRLSSGFHTPFIINKYFQIGKKIFMSESRY